MIHYLLYSFPKDNKIEESKKPYFYGLIATILIIVVSLFALLLNVQLHSIITLIFGTIGFIVVAVLVEKNKKETVGVEYLKYNDTLNALRDVLKQAKYDISNDNSTSIMQNWYTKDKLKYLIEEFDKLLSSESIHDNSDVNSLKYALIPVISFAGGVIADKAELSISILIAFIVGMIILSFWGILQIVKSFADEIFYSTSKYQVKRIHSLLSDLYIRDFDESIDIITSEETT